MKLINGYSYNYNYIRLLPQTNQPSYIVQYLYNGTFILQRRDVKHTSFNLEMPPHPFSTKFANMQLLNNALFND